MRRLLLILLGLMAWSTTLPAPAAAAPMAMHHHGMPPGHCGDEGQAAIHICLGCAVDPADPAVVTRVPPVAMPAPVGRSASIPSDHRPGFDPPPPRLA